jgi:hypothetical protein
MTHVRIPSLLRNGATNFGVRPERSEEVPLIDYAISKSSQFFRQTILCTWMQRRYNFVIHSAPKLCSLEKYVVEWNLLRILLHITKHFSFSAPSYNRDNGIKSKAKVLIRKDMLDFTLKTPVYP